MNKPRRVTANLPGDLLKSAIGVTKKGITETLVIGLKLIKRTQAAEKVKAIKGKLNLDIDLDLSRERHSR